MKVSIQLSDEQANWLRHGLDLCGALSPNMWAYQILANVRDALPRPIQAGDKVQRLIGNGGIWEVVAVHDGRAWLIANGSNSITELRDLARVGEVTA